MIYTLAEQKYLHELINLCIGYYIDKKMDLNTTVLPLH